MKAQQIFEQSVKTMKMLLTKEEMMASIVRAKERGEEGNIALLEKERQNLNDLVRRIAREKASGDVLRSAPQELRDAVVIRYLRNREIFMHTFPDGIADIVADPFTIWASIMISPGDERPSA
jgi:hypothetical protein